MSKVISSKLKRVGIRKSFSKRTACFQNTPRQVSYFDDMPFPPPVNLVDVLDEEVDKSTVGSCDESDELAHSLVESSISETEGHLENLTHFFSLQALIQSGQRNGSQEMKEYGISDRSQLGGSYDKDCDCEKPQFSRRVPTRLTLRVKHVRDDAQHSCQRCYAKKNKKYLKKKHFAGKVRRLVLTRLSKRFAVKA